VAEPDLSADERAELERVRTMIVITLVLLLALGLVELIGRPAIRPGMAGHP
jgi:hypothetical protein